jgi:hypothetical protein
MGWRHDVPLDARAHRRAMRAGGPAVTTPREPDHQTRDAARLEARIKEAAAWLIGDDSAYALDREAALRAARYMLAAADQIEARMEAAYQRAIAIMDQKAP